MDAASRGNSKCEGMLTRGHNILGMGRSGHLADRIGTGMAQEENTREPGDGMWRALSS